MGKEIERKFLVLSDKYRLLGHAEQYIQGYLSLAPERIVRIRMEGEMGVITIKGMSEGIVRSEYEYLIPANEALEILETLCHQPLIRKLRYKVQISSHTWEVDEFQEENEGLVVAEIELDDANETFEVPDWIGKEVTSEKRYTNSNLVVKPYSTWQDHN
jgi:adenylate cyclase